MDFKRLLTIVAIILCLDESTIPTISAFPPFSTGLVSQDNRWSFILAKSIVNYFQLENSDEDSENLTKNCNNISYINEYFFQVYSQGSNSSITENDLNNLIHYQLTGKRNELATNKKFDKCKQINLFQAREILNLTKLDSVTPETFNQVCPFLLFNIESKSQVKEDVKHSTFTLWVIGLLLTTVVTIWSWNGAFALPFMKKRPQTYKNILIFMISLACSVLTSNSLMRYFPMADGFEEGDLDDPDMSFYFKHFLALFIIFFYFCLDRFMKILVLYKKEQKRILKETLKLSNLSTKETETTTTPLSKTMPTQQKKKNPLHRNESTQIDEFHVIGIPKLEAMTNKLYNAVEQSKENPQIFKIKKVESSVFDNISADSSETSSIKSGKLVANEMSIFGLDYGANTSQKPTATQELVSIATNNNYGQSSSSVEIMTTLDTVLEDHLENDAEHSQQQNDADKEEEMTIVESSDHDGERETKICCTSLTEGLANVRPIGWMAIFGDGLGNFVDGLSIGASMNQGLVVGFSTAIAAWCGNIPQELGDYALLLRAGMTPFQALFYNYMSSLTAYIGFIIGITVGSSIDAARWIFSISTGSCLYLGLGVLLPEICEEFEENKGTFKEKINITILQLSGLLSGYIIVFILAAFV